MKTKDIPGLKGQVMRMLPITQAEVWKALRLSSKDGSELIGYMISDKLVKRTIIKIKGKRTFLLESSNGRTRKFEPSILLSGDKFSPCCRCEKDCAPSDCMQLTEWAVQLQSNK